jgi:hypothetical protein
MKSFRFTVTFRDRDLPGVLDMLRYDQAVVLDWRHSPAKPGRWSDDRWTITLSAPRCTADRWQSFGLYPAHAF